MEKILIRKATITDLPQIQSLDSGLFHHEALYDPLINTHWPYEDDGERFLRTTITSPSAVCLVAQTEKNELIGFITGFILEIDTTRPVKKSQLANIFIKDEYREKGIGKQLVEKFFQWSHEKEVQKARVIVRNVNEIAIGFYKKMTFQPHHMTMEADIVQQEMKK